MKRRSLVALLLCLVLLLSCGCSTTRKTFTADGMTITLTEDFAEKEMPGYTAAYQAEDILVLTLKEDFAVLGDSMERDAYGELILEANGIDAQIQYKSGHTFFVYEKNVEGKDMTYTAVLYKGDDAYWLIQFACLSSDYSKLKKTIFRYANSVEF